MTVCDLGHVNVALGEACKFMCKWPINVWIQPGWNSLLLKWVGDKLMRQWRNLSNKSYKNIWFLSQTRGFLSLSNGNQQLAGWKTILGSRECWLAFDEVERHSQPGPTALPWIQIPESALCGWKAKFNVSWKCFRKHGQKNFTST